VIVVAILPNDRNFGSGAKNVNLTDNSGISIK
jgi:hypothetical protein